MPDDRAEKKARARRRSRPELADMVAEGLYIASAATRLALKNHILVEAIANDEDFDVDRLVPEARAILLGLAAEAGEDAERTKRERKVARGRFSGSTGTHDYRRRDVRNLRRRQRQSEQVAAALRVRADDPHELRQLVRTARDEAWGELSRNIDRTLRIESARPDLDPDYPRMREARMQSLRLVDLPRLAAHRRRLAPDPGDEDSRPADA